MTADLSAPTIDPTSGAAVLAERALIGALLHMPAGPARDVLRWVHPGDLCDPQLRAIAQAIGNLASEGLDPQPALVAPRMIRDRLLPAQLGGQANAVIAELVAEVPVVACWPTYGATVLDAAIRRELAATADRLAQAAQTSSLPACVAVLDTATADLRRRLGRLMSTPADRSAPEPAMTPPPRPYLAGDPK